MQECVACEHILFPRTLEGDETIAHNEVLVALRRDFFLHVGELHHTAYGVGELARPRVLCTVRDVLCRLIECVEMRLAEFLVRRMEPVDIECAFLQILDGDRCVFGDDALHVPRNFAHMRLEVITAARHAAPAEVRLDERNPLRCVHRGLNQARFCDARTHKRRLQVCRCFPCARVGDAQQMAERRCLLSIPARVPSAAVELQCAQCLQDVYEDRDALDTRDAVHGGGVACRSVAAPQLR